MRERAKTKGDEAESKKGKRSLRQSTKGAAPPRPQGGEDTCVRACFRAMCRVLGVSVRRVRQVCLSGVFVALLPRRVRSLIRVLGSFVVLCSRSHAPRVFVTLRVRLAFCADGYLLLRCYIPLTLAPF